MSQREQNKQEKRTRIVDAAKHIIAKEGIDYLSMRHLAEVAGVSSRTPYNLFESKTDILFAIMLQSMGPLEDLDVTDDSGLAIAMLLGRLESLLALTDERAEFFRSIHWAIMRSDDIEAKVHGRLMLDQLIADHISQLREQGELKNDCDDASLTMHLGILLASILGMWADSQLSLREAATHTRYAWINSLLPQARGKALRYLRENATNDLPQKASRSKARVA